MEIRQNERHRIGSMLTAITIVVVILPSTVLGVLARLDAIVSTRPGCRLSCNQTTRACITRFCCECTHAYTTLEKREHAVISTSTFAIEIVSYRWNVSPFNNKRREPSPTPRLIFLLFTLGSFCTQIGGFSSSRSRISLSDVPPRRESLHRLAYIIILSG